jgi:hypothetical protein
MRSLQSAVNGPTEWQSLCGAFGLIRASRKRASMYMVRITTAVRQQRALHNPAAAAAQRAVPTGLDGLNSSCSLKQMDERASSFYLQVLSGRCAQTAAGQGGCAAAGSIELCRSFLGCVSVLRASKTLSHNV